MEWCAWLQCRRKLSAVFRDELRRQEGADGGEDLMSALMRTEDEGGRLLSDEEVVVWWTTSCRWC